MKDDLAICEAGPRDGLKNEARFIPASAKIALIDLHSAAGPRKIELTSLVGPRWVSAFSRLPRAPSARRTSTARRRAPCEGIERGSEMA